MEIEGKKVALILIKVDKEKKICHISQSSFEIMERDNSLDPTTTHLHVYSI